MLPSVAANCSAALTVPVCTCCPEAVEVDVEGVIPVRVAAAALADDGSKETLTPTLPAPPAAASLFPAAASLGVSSCSWRQTGQVLWSSSQGMIQSEWNTCLHFSSRTSSPILKSSQQTEHCALASEITRKMKSYVMTFKMYSNKIYKINWENRESRSMQKSFEVKPKNSNA